MEYAMSVGHEDMEGEWLRRLKGDDSATRFSSHAHPGVLINEHNQLVTMPDSLRREMYDDLYDSRRGEGALDLFNQVGLEFGRGERLSPAMRKHYGQKMVDHAATTRDARDAAQRAALKDAIFPEG